MLRAGSARDSLAVEKSYNQDGVAFSVYVAKGPDRFKLRFPINISPYMSLRELLRQSCITELECLEDLWMSGDLADREGTHILSYEKLYDLDPDIRRGLGLPECATVDVSRCTVSGFFDSNRPVRLTLS